MTNKTIIPRQSSPTLMDRFGNFIFKKSIKYREPLQNEHLTLDGNITLAHSLKKFINYFLIQIQLKLKNSYVFGRPYDIYIDPTNICNLKCPLCPTGMDKPGRSRKKMSFDEYKQIMAELGSYIYSLNLYNWGEPLLNSEIFDMIEYASNMRIITEISTNLNIMDESDAHRLITSGLTHVIISLDAANPETYQIYRKNGDYNKVIQNIKTLVAEKKKMGSYLPIITIRCLVTSYNENEIEQINKLAADLGVDHTHFGQINLDVPDEELHWLPKDNKFSRYVEGKRITLDDSCSWLWARAVINSDGTVSPCCSRLTFDERYDFGNILSNGFGEIWNNDKYRSSRKLICHNVESNMDTPCTICHKDGVYI